MHLDPFWMGAFVLIALLFDFLNGFHDSANIVATMISSRALSPVQALVIAAVCEFIGPFLFGMAVATTIGHQIVAEDTLSILLIVAALLSAISWNIATWYLGIPSSSSHALIGGLVGSAFMAKLVTLIKAGSFEGMATLGSAAGAVHAQGVIKVILSLLISPPLGFIAGFVLIKLILLLSRAASPRVNWLFKRGQTVTAVALALSHGTNDAQKTMGIIAMALFASGYTKEFTVPWWVVAACAAAIGTGTAAGGWRLIKTIGGKFYKIRPIHGFTTQVAAGLLILGASLLGGPVSTTHVVTTAVMGAGSGERLNKVRWGTGRQIVVAWILTMPVAALLAALLYLGIWSLPWVG